MDDLAQTPEEYVGELVQALRDLDEQKIRNHLRKYDIPAPSSPMAFWGMVHKTITGNTRFPRGLRRRSKKWLKKHGFQSWDDGDI